MQNFYARFILPFMPYLMMGVIIVIGIVGFILLSYLLVWAALVALVLYAIAWVRGKFSQKKTSTRKGRTIDYKDEL